MLSKEAEWWDQPWIILMLHSHSDIHISHLVKLVTRAGRKCDASNRHISCPRELVNEHCLRSVGTCAPDTQPRAAYSGVLGLNKFSVASSPQERQKRIDSRLFSDALRPNIKHTGAHRK
jgi:hypothetical protein